MSGLRVLVVEVNISVTDVNVPSDGVQAGSDGQAQPGAHQRVQ